MSRPRRKELGSIRLFGQVAFGENVRRGLETEIATLVEGAALQEPEYKSGVKYETPFGLVLVHTVRGQSRDSEGNTHGVTVSAADPMKKVSAADTEELLTLLTERVGNAVVLLKPTKRSTAKKAA